MKCLSILPNNNILILNELRDSLAVIFQNLHLNKIFWFILHSVLSVCNNIIPGWENEIFLWWCWKPAIYVQILSFTSVKMHYFQFQQENKHCLKKKFPPKNSGRKNVRYNQAWISFLLMRNPTFSRRFILLPFYLLKKNLKTSNLSSSHYFPSALSLLLIALSY